MGRHGGFFRGCGCAGRLLVSAVPVPDAGAGGYQALVRLGGPAGPSGSDLSDLYFFFLRRSPFSGAAHRQRDVAVPFQVFYRSFQNVCKREETQAVLPDRGPCGKYPFYSAHRAGGVPLCGRDLLKKSILAICDVERSYAYNFMEYINQKRSVPFEIQAFTNTDTLLAFGSKEDIDILLISDKAMCDQVKELGVENIVMISEVS